jgi:hypothetical protein
LSVSSAIAASLENDIGMIATLFAERTSDPDVSSDAEAQPARPTTNACAQTNFQE